MPESFVLVLTDQLRYDAVATPLVATPAFDRLAAEGWRATHAFTPTGLCSPARASLLTGQYAHHHGVLTNVHGPDALFTDLRPGTPTFPALLRDAGYETAYVGKYHVSADEAAGRHGFTRPVVTGEYWTSDDFLDWRERRGVARDEPVFPIDRSTRNGVPVSGRERVPADATPPAYLLDVALRELAALRAAGTPFLLVLSFLGPHWPHCVPEPYWSAYDPAPRWPSLDDDGVGKSGALAKLREHAGVDLWGEEEWAAATSSYLASVAYHDAMVGEFVAACADLPTVVTTDHGDMAGSHRVFNKGPVMYDDVYRIPLLVRWPGVTTPGSASDAFVSTLDLAATFADAAGLRLDSDGRSLLPLLRGETPAGWRGEFCAQFHGDEWGLLSQRMVRTRSHKYVYNPHDLDELYDLDADPWEMRNLAADPACGDLRRALGSRLLASLRATGDPLAAVAGGALG